MAANLFWFVGVEYRVGIGGWADQDRDLAVIDWASYRYSCFLVAMSDQFRIGASSKPANVRRRGFLTRWLLGGSVVASLPVMGLRASADENDPPGSGNRRGRRPGGRRPGGGRPDGGQSGGRPGRQGGENGGGMRDPKAMADRLIKMHDKDGDGALNADELAAALEEMARRRRDAVGQGGGERSNDGRPGGARPGGARPGGARPGASRPGASRPGEGSPAGGGVVPKRPGGN